MTKLSWNDPGTRVYEAGVSEAALYLKDGSVVAWNGLTSVTQKQGGDPPSAHYYDGVPFLVEPIPGGFIGTLEAFTYPDEFERCDGSMELANGFYAKNQENEEFSLVYKTGVGNDLEDSSRHYKLHILFNLTAHPSDKTYSTKTQIVTPSKFVWEFTSRPPVVSGFRPTAHFVIDSRKIDPSILQAFEDLLYGTPFTEPQFPSAEEVIGMVEGTYIDVLDGGAPNYTTPDIVDGNVPNGIVDGGSEISPPLKNLAVNPKLVITGEGSLRGWFAPTAGRTVVTEGVRFQAAHVNSAFYVYANITKWTGGNYYLFKIKAKLEASVGSGITSMSVGPISSGEWATVITQEVVPNNEEMAEYYAVVRADSTYPGVFYVGVRANVNPLTTDAFVTVNDAMLLNLGTELPEGPYPEFFYGGSPSTLEYDFSWEEAPNNSVSIATGKPLL